MHMPSVKCVFALNLLFYRTNKQKLRQFIGIATAHMHFVEIYLFCILCNENDADNLFRNNVVICREMLHR